VAAIVLSFVLACVVLWIGVGMWLGRPLRLDALAWFGIATLPAFVVYFAIRRDVSTAGLVVAVLGWLGFVALLAVVRRRPVRRVGEGGGTQKPS
jgi:hypothetical protein